ncbi:T9SS type A sorting domain-containing protein [Psychroserpens sp. SPM9]|uniref:DUF7619 domain-containing protein n=1 Tax=Psychroserpens sp. SPM9 TaxID=2975598 RepID=UPI0021A3ADE0|nr:T9SS type A sorting domain-containing protein [Psychroserpens sp. SPM9]MDG5491488.1 T9SS type A sorting domain-containing protein [Psychroserpens sp. SPM9]
MKKFLLLSCLTFSLFCSSQTVINMQNGNFAACEATFADSGQNSAYGNNENFTMTICPEIEGSFIRLNFNGFLTEFGEDVLTIYNGDSTDAPIHGVYSGGNSPVLVNAYNPSGCLTFNFVSNGDETFIGWNADITCVPTFIMNQPTDYELCGFNNETVANFDLESKTPEILGNLNPNDYTVTYFLDNTSAESNENPLASPFVNFTNPQTIYARVTENATGNYNIAFFSLIVNGVDVEGVQIETFSCGDGNEAGISTFDLTQFDEELANGNPNLSVFYFLNYEDAINNTNVITNPEAYTNTVPYEETIIPRIVDNTTGCFFVSGNTALHLYVDEIAELNPPTPLEVCDDDSDGIASFNLDSKTDEILGGNQNPSLIVTYHETLVDAENGINPIASPYTNIVQSFQTVFVRVESNFGNCIQTTTLDLIVTTDCLAVLPATITFCTDDPNFVGVFDLTSQNTQIVNGQDVSGYDFTYYLSETNAISQNNPIANPTAYQSNIDTLVIYVRVVDLATDNSAITTLTIDGNLNPLIAYNGPTTICDGQEVVLTPFVSGGSGQYNYLWSTGSTEPDLIVFNGGTYTVDVIDAFTNCTSSLTIEVTEGSIQTITDPENISSCEAISEFDLTIVIPEIEVQLNGQAANITFYNLLNDAYNDVNQITNPTAYQINGFIETIYVRVENQDNGCFTVVDFSISSENCPIEVSCGETPVNTSFCYVNNEATQYTYESSDSSPLQVTFNAGQVEVGYDALLVLDSDGTNLNPVETQYGNNGDLTGLSFTSSGNSITILVTSDDSISCNNQNYTPIDFDVICLDTDAVPSCNAVLESPTNSEIDVVEHTDLVWAAASGIVNGYKVSVGITSGGTEILDHLDVGNVLTHDLGILDYQVTYFVTITPYNDNGDAEDCIEESFTIRANPNQVVDCGDGPINTMYCYANDDTSEFNFESSNGQALTLVFNSGTTEVNYDEVSILDSDGTVLNPTLPYGNDGDFSGLTFTSTGNRISVVLNSDESLSCDVGSNCCTEPFDFDVYCATSIGTLDVNAFVDTNANSIFDANEINFSNGYFTYEVNGDGIVNTVNSSTGNFQIITSETDTYEISFNLYEESAGCYDVTSSTFSNINVSNGSTLTVDFPVVEQQNCEDLAVYLINGWIPPRPGFTHENTLVLENLGFSTIASGTVEFTHDPLLVFENVTNVNPNYTITITATGFTVDFVNMQPGAVETLYISLSCPVAVELGDIVTNTASYTTDGNDLVPVNNDTTLSEIVVGSWDPNDKMEAHGPRIVYDDFVVSDEYLYYTIRFQNLGTFPATYVRIEDMLNEQLDETTFQMLRASHDYVVTRTDSSLEWFFDNINLPAEQDDAEGSHGFVYFKIKPKAGYAIDDIIPNTAAIFFDFNTPVITNRFDSQFVAESLSVSDLDLNTFELFPNPTNALVTIRLHANSYGKLSVHLTDIQGKQILETQISNANQMTMDVSDLQSGLYFVTLSTKGQTVVKKLIIE